MPEFSPPSWNLMPRMFTDAVVIGFTSTFLTISLVKMFSLKNRQIINYNHELTALGVITVGASLLSSFAPSGSVSRSMVCEGAGAKTPLNGIASSILVVFVLLFLGPYFSVTPTCILSAIIAVALKNILSHLCHIPNMWRTYKRDFFLFMITFLATLLLDITIGLVVGIIGCLLALTEQQRKPHLTVLNNIPGTEIFARGTYKSPDNHPHLFKLDDYEQYIIVCGLVGSLNFASAEKLSSDVFKVIRQEEKERRSRMEKQIDNHPADDDVGRPQYTFGREVPSGMVEDRVTSACRQISNISEPDARFSTENRETMSRKTFLLLELNGLSHVDPTGAHVLQTLHYELIEDHVVPIYVGGKSFQYNDSHLSEFRRQTERLFLRHHLKEFTHHKCLNISTWAQPTLLDLTYPTVYDAYSACMDYVARCSLQTMTLRTMEEQESSTTGPNC
ncbi:uncharacterized protein DEA37_0006718 [Paragonimus westermani]|uniref:STAS domain-containing protein n=1 Tax=Paragonimus westermani TaxID=34504 RepID=A0A5J4NG86_9TREM|nr:uncharacterized protein DEA37_0006718 [Paragonimus westermani]